MKEKELVFKKLLTVEEMFLLYSKLSEAIITKIDIRNFGFDNTSLENSIELLSELGLIKYDEREDVFIRTAGIMIHFNDFTESLYSQLKIKYPNVFWTIKQADLLFDESVTQYYIKRNSLKLDYSGFLMLIDGLGKVRIVRNDIYILDKALLTLETTQRKSKIIKSLEELKVEIERNEELGREAELEAMKYEKNVLQQMSIDKLPERISEYNTSAGYDIASFMNSTSDAYDKYIEVKSCFDSSLNFYISRNELEIAKKKNNNYFLYLYNRNNKTFRIIQNPFHYLFTSEDRVYWKVEPQLYKINLI